jgi:RNA polymerase sigma-70 factor (ECF subfamily)
MEIMSQETRTRFDRLIWPHRAMILRTAQILLHNSVEAEDLAQETLMKAFKGLDSFQENTNVEAWLLSILRNVRIDYLRRSSRWAGTASLSEVEGELEDRRAEDGSEKDLWQDPEALLEAFSDQQVIEALQGLPEEIRWTLLLVDVQGLDQQAAGQILQVPVGTIKSRAHRGRAMLRRELVGLAREMRLIRPVR